MTLKNFIAPKVRCCPDGGPQFVSGGFSATLNADPELSDGFIETGNLIAVAPRLEHCVHEVAHAATALSLGVEVKGATTTSANYPTAGLSAADAIFTLLAGQIGSEFFAQEALFPPSESPNLCGDPNIGTGSNTTVRHGRASCRRRMRKAGDG